MSKLPQLQAEDLEKVAVKAGFTYDRTSGSHFIYFREEDQESISIPKYKGKTLGKGLAHSLIKRNSAVEVTSHFSDKSILLHSDIQLSQNFKTSKLLVEFVHARGGRSKR